jgi:hypothetical protein
VIVTTFMLVCKADTTIGVSVGAQTEISPDLREDWLVVEMFARSNLSWYAEQEGAQIVGPIHWSLHDDGVPFRRMIEQGVWR